MEPPIIVDENGDADFFETVEYAERYIEAPDVENGIYTIFDKNGTILIPSVKKKLSGGKLFIFFGPRYYTLNVEIKEGTKKDPERLKAILKRLIPAMEERRGLESNGDRTDDLETLLARAIELGGYTI